MTNKERLEANNEKIKEIQKTLDNKILKANQETIDTLKGVLDGSLVEFDNTKLELESLASYRFNGFKNLQKANLTGLTDIPEHICESCSNLVNLILDSDIEHIGEYAFSNCTKIDFSLNTNKLCNIDQYAFRASSISGITGKFGNIGPYSFYRMTSNFINIDAIINGTIGSFAFQDAYYVNKFKISKESIVSGTLDDYCFSGAGSSRENPENNIFDLDFSNSKFTIIDQYAFGTSSSSYKNRYYNIKFPVTLTTINSYAFRYSDNMVLYFKGSIPATLNSNAFNNATNLTICVNYSSINAYKTATNWATYADKIRGYADVGTFSKGQSLPKYSMEGYALTWYSDINLINQVTTVEDENAIYYCSLGAEQIEVVGISSIYTDNSTITVMNDTGYIYAPGEGILVGTQLTITAQPTVSGYIPYLLTLNGDSFTSPYTYTTIADTDINIVSIYYDGVNIPINPDFNANSWAIIKSVIQSGEAGQYWTVKQVKEIEVEGVVYGLRLADMQIGRYDYASGTRKTNAVLEFVQLPLSQRMNATGTNKGGWAEAELMTSLNTDFIKKLPADLQAILEDVVIPGANGGSSNYSDITTCVCKLFIAAAREVNITSSSYSYEGEGTVWDAYVGAGNADRVKYRNGSATGWWLRSPYPSSTSSFSYVTNRGSNSSSGANGSYGVAPCFAI